MKILWALALVNGSWETGFRAHLASNRYRGIIPAMELRNRGCTIDIVDFARWPAEHTDTLTAGDVAVIGKFVTGPDAQTTQRKEETLRARTAAWRARGVAVIVDFSDDRFDDKAIGPTWSLLVQRASVCVTGSNELAERVRNRFGAQAVVIGDPLASPAAACRTFRAPSTWSSRLSVLVGRNEQRSCLRMTWYGHSSNWRPLQRWAQDLVTLGRKQPWRLTIVTSPNDEVSAFVNSFNETHAPRAQIEFIPWSEQAQWQVVVESHIVLLPSKLDNAQKTVKTANRLTDALNAGCYVIATPLPAYLPFEAGAALSDDVVAEVKRYLSDPDAAQRRVATGQALAITPGEATMQQAVKRAQPTHA
jgi:hypothetical protein